MLSLDDGSYITAITNSHPQMNPGGASSSAEEEEEIVFTDENEDEIITELEESVLIEDNEELNKPQVQKFLLGWFWINS